MSQHDDLREEAAFMREMFGECAASKAADQMADATHEWKDSFRCLDFYRAQEPLQGWWSPSNPDGARWWVPSDFVPGWGEQGRAA